MGDTGSAAAVLPWAAHEQDEGDGLPITLLLLEVEDAMGPELMGRVRGIAESPTAWDDVRFVAPVLLVFFLAAALVAFLRRER